MLELLWGGSSADTTVGSEVRAAMTGKGGARSKVAVKAPNHPGQPAYFDAQPGKVWLYVLSLSVVMRRRPANTLVSGSAKRQILPLDMNHNELSKSVK